MPKRLVAIGLAAALILAAAGTAAAATHTMSWRFTIFNNPNARQVAINLAEQQAALVEEEEDPLDRFREQLERRMMSQVHRAIIDMIFDEDVDPEGEFTVGDLEVLVTEVNGQVIIKVTNVVTGETTIIEYDTDPWPLTW